MKNQKVKDQPDTNKQYLQIGAMTWQINQPWHSKAELRSLISMSERRWWMLIICYHGISTPDHKFVCLKSRRRVIQKSSIKNIGECWENSSWMLWLKIHMTGRISIDQTKGRMRNRIRPRSSGSMGILHTCWKSRDWCRKRKYSFIWEMEMTSFRKKTWKMKLLSIIQAGSGKERQRILQNWTGMPTICQPISTCLWSLWTWSTERLPKKAAESLSQGINHVAACRLRAILTPKW